MRTIPSLLAALLCGLCLIACSKESPPTEKKEEPAVQIPQPATLPSSQMVEKAEKELKETLTVGGQEAKPGTEGTVKEAPASAEPVKSAKAEVPEPAKGAAGPGLVAYEASMGKVSFDHAGHAGRMACSKCHGTDPPQKIAIDKEVAHNQLCTVCHKASGGKAPTSCAGCHKK